MPEIRSITIDELDLIGLDEENRLYWDGKPIVVEERVSLGWWVNVAVVVGSLSTLALAIFEALKFFGK